MVGCCYLMDGVLGPSNQSESWATIESRVFAIWSIVGTSNSRHKFDVRNIQVLSKFVFKNTMAYIHVALEHKLPTSITMFIFRVYTFSYETICDIIQVQVVTTKQYERVLTRSSSFQLGRKFHLQWIAYMINSNEREEPTANYCWTNWVWENNQLKFKTSRTLPIF